MAKVLIIDDDKKNSYGIYNQNIAKIVRHIGFKTAATTKPGVERHGFKDPINIFRYEIKNIDDFNACTRFL